MRQTGAVLAPSLHRDTSIYCGFGQSPIARVVLSVSDASRDAPMTWEIFSLGIRDSAGLPRVTTNSR